MGHDAVVVAVTVEVTGGCVTGIRVVVVVVDVAVVVTAGAVTVAVTVEGVGTVITEKTVEVSSASYSYIALLIVYIFILHTAIHLYYRDYTICMYIGGSTCILYRNVRLGIHRHLAWQVLLLSEM